ncbi:MAG: hypothetical protein A2X28_01335 [Elusimicrobia bacterium GWA2_56_46]|nr:MAG: hypothetical protein A2X28_01335 [Elusimicrobia bacterium GWA2_56_46]OGR53800.1 MAG: hypothetical protein A2X39_06735 [Elusimicrobia bacterium GWC2_56_31]
MERVNMKIIKLALGLSILPGCAAPLSAQTADDISFFEEEARVITASRQAVPARKAPASVYVITSEDIETAGGAVRLWDLIKNVPGVDVIESRSFYGNVSIRGLNEPLNNRTLVMLDGKTVLHPFYGIVNWEDIPVSMSEIDRIEIVAGPVSALYGANAIQGVINIITKKPEQLGGGTITYSAGSRDTFLGSALYGTKKGNLAYKIGADQRRANRFEDPDKPAERVGKVHALVSYDYGPETTASFSGGYSDTNYIVSLGPAGTGNVDGYTSYLRTDFTRSGAKARFFWNRDRLDVRDFTAFNDPNMYSDSYDFNLEKSVDLFPGDILTLGGGYTRNTINSRVFSPERNKQELWALSMENKWEPSDAWAFVASARLDHHSLTGYAFSPRAGTVYSLTPSQTFRLSAGTAFRNPSLVENYLALIQTLPNDGAQLPNPPFTTIESTLLGSRKLDTEKIYSLEAAHNGIFGKLKTTTAVYTYLLKDIVKMSDSRTTCTVACIPAVKTEAVFTNQGSARGWGAETGAELAMTRRLRSFANYTFLSVQNYSNSPKHKANGGIKYADGRLTADFWANWVYKTFWNLNSPGAEELLKRVGSYAVLNARTGYRFKGKLEGLQAGFSAFNLLNDRHYETLPGESSSQPGQNGEIIGARYAADVSYRF